VNASHSSGGALLESRNGPPAELPILGGGVIWTPPHHIMVPWVHASPDTELAQLQLSRFAGHIRVPDARTEADQGTLILLTLAPCGQSFLHKPAASWRRGVVVSGVRQ